MYRCFLVILSCLTFTRIELVFYRQFEAIAAARQRTNFLVVVVVDCCTNVHEALRYGRIGDDLISPDVLE